MQITRSVIRKSGALIQKCIESKKWFKHRNHYLCNSCEIKMNNELCHSWDGFYFSCSAPSLSSVRSVPTIAITMSPISVRNAFEVRSQRQLYNQLKLFSVNCLFVNHISPERLNNLFKYLKIHSKVGHIFNCR